MLALRLESVLIGHIAQCDDVTLGIAVSVRAGLHQHQLLVFIDDLSITGLGLRHNDLLQVAHILHTNAVGCLVTVEGERRILSGVATLAWYCRVSPAVEAAVGIVHIVLLDNACRCCCCGHCISSASILWTCQDVGQHQGRAQNTHELVHFLLFLGLRWVILCCDRGGVGGRGK